MGSKFTITSPVLRSVQGTQGKYLLTKKDRWKFWNHNIHLTPQIMYTYKVKFSGPIIDNEAILEVNAWKGLDKWNSI